MDTDSLVTAAFVNLKLKPPTCSSLNRSHKCQFDVNFNRTYVKQTATVEQAQQMGRKSRNGQTTEKGKKDETSNARMGCPGTHTYAHRHKWRQAQE